ncbi:Cyclopropane-fatty-acyl-phospholipid synthase [Theobroma cacao]|uniref:Cyclopropane-fatty-acyl-phospholipid synthase n=1 Tax=Theobroma cacao TaxID=3641 RepID=A0A061EP92_THECC|nr:Cyclopropane-fatty-acyl-phospholipid synthase [Theobroma cacao]
MKVAVIGGGIGGLVSACVLAKAGANVVVYEKEEQVGGQAKTFNGIDLDLGFITFNPAMNPSTLELFDSLGVDVEACNMSFSVSLDNGQDYEWGTRNGFSSLFAQKQNVLNPYFWKMLRELIKFKDDVISYLQMLENNPDIDGYETLGQFIKLRDYSEPFQKAYLIPICCSIWCCTVEQVMSFSAFYTLSIFRRYHLHQLLGRPQLLTVSRHSYFANKVREMLESRGCQIRTGCEIRSVQTDDDGSNIVFGDGFQEKYNGCIMAVDAPAALKLLGNQATFDELRLLGAFQYVYSDIFFHRDVKFMPKNSSTWSALNFVKGAENKACLTYLLDVLQDVGETSVPFLVTINPDQTPKQTLHKWSTGHPIASVAASKASLQLNQIQGKRGIWFCGYGFHEDKLKAAMVTANNLLGKQCSALNQPKHIVPSFMETGARLFVTRFLGQYISTGCITILEEGGTVFTFKGSMRKCSVKTVLKVHNPQFYWKVMTEAGLGLADAFINGDFSFTDKEEGLLNLFIILIANGDSNSSATRLNKKRGWWTPSFFTASIASAKYFFKHALRQNSVTQARRNISRHYDLSNELFALFLDETMQYSSGIFKNEDEDLKVAQLRKMSSLIDKARIEKHHEVLDIGCGWGRFAIEVVRRTGCKYTGITLSEEQLKFAEAKVKEAGLQDNIRFLLCDYRQLPDTRKYDRIISCEMIEHLGDEYVEQFFRCCESALAEDGLLVLQFISIPEERFEEYRRSSDFIKEYIFPGGCLPSLNRIVTGMAAASRLCVEHVENIGMNYYLTLRCWRKNFLENQSKILALGFDEKFMRTWEYYFDYCAAGFRTYTLGDYQVVFSRPGNYKALGYPYQGFPSAY